MDMQHHHQGRLGTPDANNTASYMSSDFNNNNHQKEQQKQPQHLNSTSQTSAFGPNTQDLFAQLHEALALEPKYQPNLFLPLQSNVSISSDLFSKHYFIVMVPMTSTCVGVCLCSSQGQGANNISLSYQQNDFSLVHDRMVKLRLERVMVQRTSYDASKSGMICQTMSSSPLSISLIAS